MSTEIKPGQVWEYKRTSDTEPVTVTEVRDGMVTYVFTADQSDGDMSVVAFLKMRRLVTDTTPAHATDSQLATALLPLADAPDIENVPAASSMHVLLECATEIFHGVRQILEATKPDAIRDQDEAISLSYWLAGKMGEHVDDQGDETLTETVQRYVSREWMPKTGANPTPAPSLLDQDGDDDGREAAPLDPKSVHIGDTVTVRFKETGDEIVTKTYQPDDITAPGEYVYLLGWPLHRANGTFGLAISHFEILAIEPAPMPERKPGTVAIVTPSMWGGIVNRAIRGTDGGWYTEAGGHWDDDEVTDAHELVVIDPAAVDVDHLVDVGSNTDDPRTNTLAILASLGLDGAS